MSPRSAPRAVRRRRLATAVAALVAAAVSFATLARGEPAAVPSTTRMAAPATPAPVRRAAAPRTATVQIAATGDITFGTTPTLPPDRGVSLFAAVRSRLSGDVVLGNLETALTTGASGKCGAGSSSCFSFRAPPSYARLLARAGFTTLNLANNHALDFGATGQAETVAALDGAGLLHTGRPGEVAVQPVGPVRVAIVGFAPYPWAESLLDIAAARRAVARAAASADVVVVTMHAGAEGSAYRHVRPGPETFLGEPRGNVVAFAHAAVEAGADLVVGHGPHVLRGMEWYRGRLIAYSMGNFSAYKNFALGGPSAISGILRVTLRGDGTWSAGRLVPVRLAGTGTPRVDAGGAGIKAVRALSQQDFGRRAAAVDRSGVIRPPSAGRAARATARTGRRG